MPMTDHPGGWMFWLIRKKLVGSYLRFSSGYVLAVAKAQRLGFGRLEDLVAEVPQPAAVA
jgi:hypothetical protein